MDCYIVCNMFPPSVSAVVRAPGLRAEQLAAQARPVFDNVTFLMLKSRYDLLVKNGDMATFVRPRADFLLIHDLHSGAFLDRIEKSVFVFTQLEFVDFFKEAAERHLVVYDILAPRVLELECGNRPAPFIRRMQSAHDFQLEKSDRIFVNGAKNRLLFSEQLDGRDDVHDVPFCPVSAQEPDESARPQIMFFSSAQEWTDNAPFLVAMADYLEDHPEISSWCISSKKSHENPESAPMSRLSLLPNVRMAGGFSYQAMTSLYRQCHAVLDWSVPNMEREYSTSTRLIQAVSNGCSILANGNTGLDHFWGPFPGLSSADIPTVTSIGEYIDRSRQGGYDEAIKTAREWNAKVLSNSAAFEAMS